MVRIGIAAAALIVAALSASTASAGIYTDDLSRCLVKSATDADRADLMRWVFAEIARNPALKSIASVTPDQRGGLERKGAELFQRLVTTDCRSQTVDALKNEGSSAIGAGFSVLGQVAARGLMSDPSVMSGMASMTKYMDRDRWDALSREAGVANFMNFGPPSK